MFWINPNEILKLTWLIGIVFSSRLFPSPYFWCFQLETLFSDTPAPVHSPQKTESYFYSCQMLVTHLTAHLFTHETSFRVCFGVWYVSRQDIFGNLCLVFCSKYLVRTRFTAYLLLGLEKNCHSNRLRLSEAVLMA